MCKTPEDLDLNGIDTVAVDLETYDPNLKTKGSGALRGDGFVCGVAIATGKDTVYFNISHSDIDMSLDKKIKFWEALDEKLFQNEKITKVFHNAMYDVCWIRSITGKKMKGRIVDTMIAASVIDENRFQYSLDSLSKDFLKERKGGYDLQEKVLAWSKGAEKASKRRQTSASAVPPLGGGFGARKRMAIDLSEDAAVPAEEKTNGKKDWASEEKRLLEKAGSGFGFD